MSRVGEELKNNNQKKNLVESLTNRKLWRVGIALTGTLNFK